MSFRPGLGHRKHATNLSQMQKQALLDINSVPERATIDPSILVPVGPAIKDLEPLDRLIERLSPGFLNESTKLQVAIDSARSDIYFEFCRKVADEIIKLREIDWPKTK